MIKHNLGIKLDSEEVGILLKDYDEVFTPSLSEHLDMNVYSSKLSQNAYFLIAHNEKKEIGGFIAYYLNVQGKFAYIPLIAVSPLYQHQGIGNQMLRDLEESLNGDYNTIMLEVLKENKKGYHFYLRNGFEETEDRGEKWLMVKYLESK